MAYFPKTVQGSSVGGFTATRVPFADANGFLTEDGAFTFTAATGNLTVTKLNGLTITTSTGTLTIANAKVLTVSNTLTFTGTDGSSVAFGAGGTVAYTANKLSVFAATTSAELAGVISDKTGTGSLVFATSPTLLTSLTLTRNNATGPTLTLQNLTAAGGSNNATLEWRNNTNVLVGQIFMDSAGTGGLDLNFQPVGAAGLINFITNAIQRLRITAAGQFTIWDGATFSLGTVTGTKFGIGATDKIGFYGAAPVVQAATFAAYTSFGVSANHDLVDVATAGLADPAKVNANFDDVADGLNLIRTLLRNLGLMA